MKLEGSLIWVTGASSGLGMEIARQLATKHRANLVISARRLDRLEALKRELEAAAGVTVTTLPMDMSRMAEVEQAIQVIHGLHVRAAVLNAGVGHLGFHHELSWQQFESMIHTNVVGTSRITSELAHHARTSGRALRIMLVTSLQGFIPMPFQSAYSGTKGFLTNFGLALSQELKGTGVEVQVFAPTGVQTEMTAGERFAKLSSFLLPVEGVARQAIQALERGRPLATAMGFWERVGLSLERLLPRMVAIRIMGQVYRQSVESSGTKGSSMAVVGSVLRELFLPGRAAPRQTVEGRTLVDGGAGVSPKAPEGTSK